MEDLQKLRRLYQLKNVKRANSVGKRKESPAEHTWSCLILADYFLSRTKKKLDRLKVYELLLYHDVVEIEAGDVNLLDVKKRKEKELREKEAANTLRKTLPSPLNTKFIASFTEFEDCRTPEAKFAKAIDALDAVIHELDYKKDWKNWTEQFLREKKRPWFAEFPELQQAFAEILDYLGKEGYFKP